MKFRILILALSSILLSATSARVVAANGFFDENKYLDIAPEDQFQGYYDFYQNYQDGFISVDYNPYNYYNVPNSYISNPYNQSQPQNKPTDAVIDNVILAPEFQESSRKLEQMSEQAIRDNNLGIESLPIEEPLLKINSQSSGMDLSDLTSMSLINSARKRQLYGKLLPILLNNHRIFHEDRQRLEEMLSNFEQGNKIDIADEIWLKRLVKHFHLIGQDLKQM